MKILKSFLKTEEGRLKLAAALKNPIAMNMDFKCFARKGLELVITDRNESSSCFFNKDGKVEWSKSEDKDQREVVIPRIQLESSVVLDKIDEDMPKKIAEAFIDREEQLFLSMVEAGCKINKRKMTSTLKEGLIKIKEKYLKFSGGNIIVDEKMAGKLSKAFKDVFVKEKHKELIEAGIYGDLWGNRVWITKHIDKNKVYVCANSKYMGVMRIYSEIEPFIIIKDKKIEIVAFEVVGMCINGKNNYELTVK